MIHRLELKYRVSPPTALLLRQAIKPYVTLDPYCAKQKNSAYNVDSVYLDSSDYDEFAQKIEGVDNRSKTRLRTYTVKNKRIHFIEIKSRQGAFTLKDRLEIAEGKFQDFMKRTPYNVSCHPFNQSSVIHLLQKQLLPAIKIQYTREAYNAKYDDFLRLNFDRNIGAAGPYQQSTVIFNTKLIIFEIKCQFRIPDWLTEIIRAFNLQRISFSKYCYGLIRTNRITGYTYLFEGY